jgi:predicted DNA-binding transcriptional regulator AlpA
MQIKPTSISSVRRAYQINEAVDTYRLSRSTLYKLMSTGTPRSVKVDGRRLIPVEALEALIAAGSQ